MTDIHDISFKDVKIFLSENNKKIPTTSDKAYEIAFELMLDPNTSYNANVPDSILEWMKAYNLSESKAKIKNYTISEIQKLSQTEIDKLAKQLKMKGNNVDNIINILRFLHKFNNDVLETYPEIYEPILLNSDFEGVIALLKTNKSLRPVVMKLLPQIIKNNVNISTEFNTELEEDNLIEFIGLLINLGDLDLVKRALQISDELRPRLYIYQNSITAFIDAKLLGEYFNILPKNYDKKFLREVLKSEINSTKDDNIRFYVISKFLIFAVADKNIGLFKYIENIWTNNIRPARNDPLINDIRVVKINDLLEKGRKYLNIK